MDTQHKQWESTLKIRKCQVCGGDIPQTYSGNRCSKECDYKHRNYTQAAINARKRYDQKISEQKKQERGIRICEGCGSEFEPRSSRAITCSSKCSKKAHKRKKKLASLKTLNCNYCGTEFTQSHGQQQYCTKDCMTYAYMRRQGRKNPGFEKRQVQGKCAYCDEIFTKRKLTSKYCSATCKNLAYKDRIRFTDGSESKSKNKRKRLEVDNYQCQRCYNEDTLVVHHNKYPATIEHLVTLCRSCHAYIHKMDGGIFYPDTSE